MSDRPLLHLTATDGWINDPMALTWHDGLYHLFFQHVPGQVVWSHDQRWGHAVSPDLLHWTERPVALAPGEGDDGIWTGCLVTPDGSPEQARIFYTAVQADRLHLGAVRVARPHDPSWDTWAKGGVVAAAPDPSDSPALGGRTPTALRDPVVLRDGERWRMVQGAGLTPATGAALTWVSDDLDTWTFDGVLAERDTSVVAPVWTGSVWECPQLFPLDDAWVLTVSAWDDEVTRHEAWAVGDLVDGRFTARRWGRLGWGPGQYAGTAFTDADGAASMLHWIREVADPAAGWAGAHTVPHACRLVDGALVLQPHPAVTGARTGAPHDLRDGDLEVTGPLDLEVELDDPDAELRLTCGDAVLVLGAGRVQVDADVGAWEMPLGTTRLRVLVDGPVVEVFGDQGISAFGLAPASARTLAVAGAGVVRAWSLA